MTELMLRSELPLLAAPALLAGRAASSMGSLDELRSEPKDSRPPTPGTKLLYASVTLSEEASNISIQFDIF